jgi:hypothetical protein
MAESSEETAKESEMIKMLQGGQKVLLCFYEPSDPRLDAVKATLDTIGNNFRGALDVIYINVVDGNGEKLTAEFVTQSGYISLVVLAPPRNVIAELKGGDITKENLMKVLFSPRKAGGGCGCSGGKTC